MTAPPISSRTNATKSVMDALLHTNHSSKIMILSQWQYIMTKILVSELKCATFILNNVAKNAGLCLLNILLQWIVMNSQNPNTIHFPYQIINVKEARLIEKLGNKASISIKMYSILPISAAVVNEMGTKKHSSTFGISFCKILPINKTSVTLTSFNQM